jgi:hypothetical protein
MTTDIEIRFRDLCQLIYNIIGSPDFVEEIDWSPYHKYVGNIHNKETITFIISSQETGYGSRQYITIFFNDLNWFLFVIIHLFRMKLVMTSSLMALHLYLSFLEATKLQFLLQ